jgi:ubiquinone/menaquinone biosynthesis C-methylase UbiE
MASRAGEHAEIKGIDLSSGQIRIAKGKNCYPNVEFMVVDASDTCFAEGYFDKVMIGHALHEMPKSTRVAVLKEDRRVVKDGGTVAVLEMDTPPSLFRRLYVGFWWFYWLPFNPETPTRRDMLKHTVVEEVKEAGFRDVSKASMFHGALQVVHGHK